MFFCCLSYGEAGLLSVSLFPVVWNSVPIQRKVLAMRKASLVLLLTAFVTATAAQIGQPDSDKAHPTRVMCDAAALKLEESGTTKIVLMMTLDRSGRVESFKTESPKGLRLEKMKEAAAAIKTIKFGPAAKDGAPVAVQVRIEFDCASKKAPKTQ
jgi:hypothetical protein